MLRILRNKVSIIVLAHIQCYRGTEVEDNQQCHN